MLVRVFIERTPIEAKGFYIYCHISAVSAKLNNVF